MLFLIVYFAAIILELLFAIGFSIFTLFLFYSNFKGSPYVPTRGKEVEVILKEADLKPHQTFFELGSGDARVARSAVKKYKVKAIAVDINPLLNFYAKLFCRMQKIKNIEILRKNIFDVDLHSADVVYLFLMPKLIDKMLPKFKSELRKNSIVISHGFVIEKWKNKLYKKIDHRPFPTYYYRMD